MNLSEVVKVSLARYASFDGRARRSEYWYFTLVHLLAILLAMVVSYFAMLVIPALGFVLYSIVIFGTLLPHLAVSVRRLHDVNRSGWWYSLTIVQLLGPIVLLVWSCTDGTRGPNRFGADPKATVQSGEHVEPKSTPLRSSF
ncbi:MAG: DUF805 domain-containing protein [Candidatus Eremiobacteraeota bacterium]|nr:DUF805 domain-containing protein [Candidatus Eremiobacteraeota bacterium]